MSRPRAFPSQAKLRLYWPQLRGSHMTDITITLSAEDIRALKTRTGKRSAGAALKAWIVSADPTCTAEQLRAALLQSTKEESAGKGRRVKSGREAIRWLES